jgi:hypothetical protein
MAAPAPQPSPEGTQRRVRALMSRGWAPEAIERATDIPVSVTARLLEDRGGISEEAAARIAVAYDALWNRPPPQATTEEQQLSASALTLARRAGWAPPLAWDDDQLDLPDGRPADGWKRSAGHQRRSADLAEDARWVREHGGYRTASLTEVALRLGVSKPALEKALSRTRQAELDREAG